jgi:hypothetical protein
MLVQRYIIYFEGALYRTPSGPSWRHSWGIPTRSALPVLPTHRPMKIPVPDVMLVFSARVILATSSAALR